VDKTAFFQSKGGCFMKWTTRERNGKKTTHYVDSGVKHNPAPSTERGRRKAERKQARKK